MRRADRAGAEVERLGSELAALQAAVDAGDPAATSAAQQQVLKAAFPSVLTAFNYYSLLSIHLLYLFTCMNLKEKLSKKSFQTVFGFSCVIGSR